MENNYIPMSEIPLTAKLAKAMRFNGNNLSIEKDNEFQGILKTIFCYAANNFENTSFRYRPEKYDEEKIKVFIDKLELLGFKAYVSEDGVIGEDHHYIFHINWWD